MPRSSPFRLWFHLTRAEQKLVLAILTLAVIGLTARYVHLRGQTRPPPPTIQQPEE